MKELIKKFQEIVWEVEREKGKPFLLSGVVEPESNFGKIDLVLSAEWVEQEKVPFLRYISSKITNKLTLPELLKFGSVVLLDPKAAVTRFGMDTKEILRGERISPHRFEDVDVFNEVQIFDKQSAQHSYAH